jgi:hypothetical protein
MRLLAIELTGVGLAAVLEDERLVNIRRLVDGGAFGGLATDARPLEPLLERASDRRRLARAPDASDVDLQLGEVLEGVDRDTVLLMVATDDEGSWYVLAAPGLVPPGETGAVEADYLANLVSGLLEREALDPDEDDEALLRERFSGLGYIS